jgi:hypothetical protein
MIGSRILILAVFAAVGLSAIAGCTRREVVREREVPTREREVVREVPVERERVREVEVERR